MARLSVLRITIATILVAAALAVLFWVVWHNFPAQSQLTLSVDFTQSQPIISNLYPDQRLRSSKSTSVEVIGSPVYLAIRPGSWWDAVRFEIEYSGDTEIIDMAGRTGEGWSFAVQQPDEVVELSDGWRRALFTFDLNALYDQRNSHEFIINSTASEELPLTIHSVRAYVTQN